MGQLQVGVGAPACCQMTPGGGLQETPRFVVSPFLRGALVALILQHSRPSFPAVTLSSPHTGRPHSITWCMKFGGDELTPISTTVKAGRHRVGTNLGGGPASQERAQCYLLKASNQRTPALWKPSQGGAPFCDATLSSADLGEALEWVPERWDNSHHHLPYAHESLSEAPGIREDVPGSGTISGLISCLVGAGKSHGKAKHYLGIPKPMVSRAQGGKGCVMVSVAPLQDLKVTSILTDDGWLTSTKTEADGDPGVSF